MRNPCCLTSVVHLCAGIPKVPRLPTSSGEFARLASGTYSPTTYPLCHMTIMLTSVGLLMVGLYAGCDNLAVDNKRTGFDLQEVNPGMGETVGLVNGIIQMDELIDSASANTRCLTPPISPSDIGPLNARLDHLLGQLGDGINRSNILDHVADLDTTDWARLDSAAMNVLRDDYQTLRVEYVAGCPEDAALREAAMEIFGEYAALISRLGSDGFEELIQDALNGQAIGPCEDACDQTRRNDKQHAYEQYAAVGAGCVAMTLVVPLGFALSLVCLTGNAMMLYANLNQAMLNNRTCSAKCTDEEGDPPAGVQSLLKSRRSL